MVEVKWKIWAPSFELRGNVKRDSQEQETM